MKIGTFTEQNVFCRTTRFQFSAAAYCRPVRRKAAATHQHPPSAGTPRAGQVAGETDQTGTSDTSLTTPSSELLITDFLHSFKAFLPLFFWVFFCPVFFQNF